MRQFSCWISRRTNFDSVFSHSDLSTIIPVLTRQREAITQVSHEKNRLVSQINNLKQNSMENEATLSSYREEVEFLRESQKSLREDIATREQSLEEKEIAIKLKEAEWNEKLRSLEETHQEEVDRLKAGWSAEQASTRNLISQLESMTTARVKADEKCVSQQEEITLLRASEKDVNHWKAKCEALSSELVVAHSSNVELQSSLRSGERKFELERNLLWTDLCEKEKSFEKTIGELGVMVGEVVERLAFEEKSVGDYSGAACEVVESIYNENLMSSMAVLSTAESFFVSYEEENSLLMDSIKAYTTGVGDNGVAVVMESLKDGITALTIREEALRTQKAEIESANSQMEEARNRLDEAMQGVEHQKEILANEKQALMDLNQARDEWMAGEVDKLRNYAVMLQKKSDMYHAWQERARQAHRMIEQRLRALDHREQVNGINSGNEAALQDARDLVRQPPPACDLSPCPMPNPNETPHDKGKAHD